MTPVPDAKGRCCHFGPFRLDDLTVETGAVLSSAAAAEGKPIYCFLHYPPIYQGYKCPEMLELLDKYEVERCYYGHLHGYTHRRAFEGMREKTEYALIAADYVAFQPVKICN